MSNGDRDQVRVVGTVDEPPSRRPPGGWVLLVVGLVAGLAIGALFSRSDVPTDTTTEIAATTTTDLPTSGDSSPEEELEVSVVGFMERVYELEAQLDDANETVADLLLDADPVQYAPVVDCDARQQAYGAEADSYFIGPVGFWFAFDDLSGENLFTVVWATVEAGDSVTMMVPNSERERFSLLWTPALWRGDNSVAAGEPAVTLQACDGFPTVFLGGFAADQGYCAPLDIYFADNPEPARIILPLGVTDCPDGTIPLTQPEPGPVPDVVGLTLLDARLAIRLAALVPVINEGDPMESNGMVWTQDPSQGKTYESGRSVELRTCLPADDVVATYQERLVGTGVTLSHAWMAPNHDANFESWYFISALVRGGTADGQIATWALPGYTPGAGVDSINTPGLSVPANAVSQGFDFGYRILDPEDYGVADWIDLDGAVASQQCVVVSDGA